MCALLVCATSDLLSLSSMATVADAGDSVTPEAEEESRMLKVSSTSPSHKLSSLIGMLVH